MARAAGVEIKIGVIIWALVALAAILACSQLGLANTPNAFFTSATAQCGAVLNSTVPLALEKVEQEEGALREGQTPNEGALWQATVKYAEVLNEEAKKSGAYKVYPMRMRYIGENVIGQGGRPPVRYYNNAERARAKLTIRDGLIYDSEGKLFDTSMGTLSKPAFAQSFVTHRAIFIMERDGTFYAELDSVAGLIHHSSLSRGRPVAAAGELMVHRGKIVTYKGKTGGLSRKSGHYHTTTESILQVIDELAKHGIEYNPNDIEDPLNSWGL